MGTNEVINTECAINKIINILENSNQIYICDSEGNKFLVDDNTKEIILSNYKLDLIQKKVDVHL